MTTIQIIIGTVMAVAAAAVMFSLYKRKRNKDRLIELNCTFCLSDNIDELLDSYKRETNVNISGILGNDFMVRHGYIIDYDQMTVKHKSVRISIKDTMDILEIPLIVLYQNNTKYIFMLDTGAQNSAIHSKFIDMGLDIDKIENSNMEICGVGGSGSSDKMLTTRLYYQTR